MSCSLKILITVFVLVLLLGSTSQELIAQKDITIKLENRAEIDYCGEQINRRVILALSIGEVLLSDSIAGYNFEIKYNPEKVKFNHALCVNTLAENMQYKDVRFLEEGLIIGYAANLLGPYVIGDKPLIAFLGEYLPNCPDSSIVELSYIEFNEEFEFNIIQEIPALIEAEKIDKEGRFISLIIINDSLELKKDSVGFVQVQINRNPMYELTEFEFEMYYESFSEYNIVSIEFENENIELIDFTEIPEESKFVGKVRVIDELAHNDFLKLEIKNLSGLEFEQVLGIKIIDVGECDCYTRFYGDEVSIKGLKDVDTSSIVYKEKNNDIVLFTMGNDTFIKSKIIITNIDIYNLSGIKMANYRYEYGVEEAMIEMEYLPNGLYYGLVRLIDNKLKNIILIKN